MPHQETEGKYAKAKMDEAGRVLIPLEFRKALEMHPGQYVMLMLAPGNREIRLYTIREGIRRAQQLLAPYNPPGRSIVDEFIAERHAEAERE